MGVNMKYLIDTLSIELAQVCNLDCDMCMKGKPTGKKITKEVLEAIFNDIVFCNRLVISGGEVQTAEEELKLLLKVLKEKHVTVGQYEVITNGTLYNPNFFQLLKSHFLEGKIYISGDYFHDQSILRNGLLLDYYENVKKIMQEKHFAGIKKLPKCLYDIGNATQINYYKKTKPAVLGFINYIEEYKGQKFHYVGPLVSFDVEGNIVNCNSTYAVNGSNCLGNIFTDDLKTIFSNNAIRPLYDDIDEYGKALREREEVFYNNPNYENYAIENGKVVSKPHNITCEMTQEDIKDYVPLLTKITPKY